MREGGGGFSGQDQDWEFAQFQRLSSHGSRHRLLRPPSSLLFLGNEQRLGVAQNQGVPCFSGQAF